MTREEAREIYRIIGRYIRGEEVQRKWPDDLWRIDEDPDFNPECEYRIRPDLVYRPYNQKESYKLVGRSVKYIGGSGIYLVTAAYEGYEDNPPIMPMLTIDEKELDTTTLLYNFTFPNGNLCGMVT